MSTTLTIKGPASNRDTSKEIFYKQKSKYGGMEVTEDAWLVALEDENAKLKRLLANTILDNMVLKPMNLWVTAKHSPLPADELQQHHAVKAMCFYVEDFSINTRTLLYRMNDEIFPQ